MIMLKNIKSFFIALLLLLSFAASAQKNVFLDRNYWKSKPDRPTIESEIKKGNDPAQLNSNAFDATVYAILEQAPDESIKFLLAQKGNEVNKVTHDGRTYIFWAAYKGNVGLMQYLLDKGAKTDLLDDKGYTVLNFAASSGQTNTKVYDFCLAHGANLKKDVDHDGANALLLAALYDTDFSLINYFVSKGLDLKSVDSNGNTAFNYAAKTGNLITLKTLVEKGVKFNDNAMIFASQGTRSTSNTLETYQYLESLRIKPTAIGKNGETTLHAIVRKEKQLEIINYFLGKGVDLNRADNDGNTIFMNAASANNDPQVIELLASKTKDLNQKNKKGVSALAFAVKNNTPQIVDLLLKKGADVKITDANGDNLAYYLIQSYNSQKKEAFEAKLKMLQEKGLNVVVPQKNGNTLYHLAVAQNDLSLLKDISRFKGDINAKNKDGLTALHKAALTAKDDSILKFLIESGAKKEAVTDMKETAYDLASENEYLEKNKISIDFLK
ncbi:hypothetical protein FNO01nite_02340 [Flavobacterium noncentrifugens]|nr:ankyrin repeat domain-containing protein [Flavobacterium noncentrifugens]GEP49562.1 hypothetical protein FNO01nite_02340 [Flavobacterium noncentrifugens]